MVAAHKNFNGLRDLTTPLSGMFCHPRARIDLSTKAEVYLHALRRYKMRYKMSKMEWFEVDRGHPKSLEIASFDRAHISFY